MSVLRPFARRVRRGLERRAKRALEVVGVLTPASVPHPAAPAPAVRASPLVPPAAPIAPPAAPVADPVVPSAGPVLSRETVEEILEDMVRPALQSDGGDITLVRVDPEGDIYVELVGACSSCPSATVTMRQGIERLFEAELPGFRSLIEVNGMGNLPPGAIA